MTSTTKLLDQVVVEKAKMALQKIGKSALCARKLEAVISAKKHGITQVAKVCDITRTTLTSWIKLIKNDKIERLNAPPERKRKSKLNEDQRKQILEWIKIKNFMFLVILSSLQVELYITIALLSRNFHINFLLKVEKTQILNFY